jgi:acyl-CoA reductase-like NAD-dependent aldehyde dehydrogenase
MTQRLTVRKTYKLYVGGAFTRSESGRHDPVLDHRSAHVANVTRGSRKDVRDAVRAARRAQPGWAARTAYNRGQVLYRAAEALESRAGELAAQAVALRGVTKAAATTEVEAAVDTLVHYAGWTDKLAAVLGGVNPVAAPFLSFSVPEPTGVIGVLAPEAPDLLGLVGAIAAPLAAGDTVVAVCSERWPLSGLDLGEVLAVSDVPAGVVNLLAGRRRELAVALAGHRDVNAIVDADGDAELGAEVDRLASETVKRVLHIREPDGPGTAREESLGRLEAVLELKTAWHPVGA